MNSPNVINEVLGAAEKGEVSLPEPDAPVSEIGSGARETMHALEELAVPVLKPAQRKSYAGQARPTQAAMTEVAERILARSSRVAHKARLQPLSVHNLLLTETGLGAVRGAAWTLSLYALLRLQRSGAALDQVLQRIEDLAARPGNGDMRRALGQAQHVQQKKKQSNKAKQARKDRKQTRAGAALADQQQSVARRRSADLLATDVNSGAARAHLPETRTGIVDAIGQPAATLAKAGKSKTGTATRPRRGRAGTARKSTTQRR